MPEDDYRTILGLRIFVGTPEESVALGMRGGLVVVPSAPVLLYMVDDLVLRQALLDAKLAISDSGLMVLVWNLSSVTPSGAYPGSNTSAARGGAGFSRARRVVLDHAARGGAGKNVALARATRRSRDTRRLFTSTDVMARAR